MVGDDHQRPVFRRAAFHAHPNAKHAQGEPVPQARHDAVAEERCAQRDFLHHHERKRVERDHQDRDDETKRAEHQPLISPSLRPNAAPLRGMDAYSISPPGGNTALAETV